MITFSGVLNMVNAQDTTPSRYIQEFVVPLPASGPLGIASGKEGVIWFTMEGANGIGYFDTKTEEFNLFEIPWKPVAETKQFGLDGIIVDDNGIVWFTHGSTNRIGKFDTRNNSFEGVEIPTPNAGPFGLLMDSEGNLWFSELRGDKIGVIRSDGSINEFELPQPFSGPAGLTFDTDGKIWFTEAFGGRIGILDPVTGTIKEIEPPPRFTLFSPVGIVVDFEGVVWLTDHGGSEIIRFDPEMNSWRKFSTSEAPPEIYPVSLPNDLEMDQNGFLWLAEHAGNKISRFDRKTEILTEYTIPTFRAISLWLTIDPDGRIWFTEAEGNKIGVIDPTELVPFSVSLSPKSIPIEAGSTVAFTMSVYVNDVFDRPLDLSIYGSPTSIEFEFETKEISMVNSEDSVLEVMVTAPKELENVDYFLSLSASDLSVTQTVTATLTTDSEDISTTLVSVLIMVTLVLLTVWFLIRRRIKNYSTST